MALGYYKGGEFRKVATSPDAVAIPSGGSASNFGLPGVDLYGDNTGITFAGGFVTVYGPIYVEFPITVTEAMLEVQNVGAGNHRLALCQADDEWQPIPGTVLTISDSVDVTTTGVKIVTGLDLDVSPGRWLTIQSQYDTAGGNTQVRNQCGAPPGIGFLPDAYSSTAQSGYMRVLNPSSLTDPWGWHKFANAGRGVQQSFFLKWRKQ